MIIFKATFLSKNFAKNTTVSNLKSVRAENEDGELGTLTYEHCRSHVEFQIS